MTLFRIISTSLLFLFIINVSIAQNLGDCMTAFPICDRAFLHFKISEGMGYVLDAPKVDCFMNGNNMGQAETNSTWISFNIKDEGELSFVITPDVKEDDLDFVLFQLPIDGNCDYKKIVRCMAAGDGSSQKSPCMGATGLRFKEKDTEADAGCNDYGDNNWLRPLQAKSGEKYVLLVSNITAPNGFTIRFEGSALLEPCAVEGGP